MEVHANLHRTQWALARSGFILYLLFSGVTLVGGILTVPLMTWLFFGDWRFWRHWRTVLKLLPHGLSLTRMMVSDGRAFMFSVPLTSPPRSIPDRSIARFHSEWDHAESCGECTNCCRPGGKVCPLLDAKQQNCLGYNSFYWRYFNCGRYPSFKEEIEYYACPKWVLVPTIEPSIGRLAETSPLASVTES